MTAETRVNAERVEHAAVAVDSAARGVRGQPADRIATECECYTHDILIGSLRRLVRRRRFTDLS